MSPAPLVFLSDAIFHSISGVAVKHEDVPVIDQNTSACRNWQAVRRVRERHQGPSHIAAVKTSSCETLLYKRREKSPLCRYTYFNSKCALTGVTCPNVSDTFSADKWVDMFSQLKGFQASNLTESNLYLSTMARPLKVTYYTIF